MKKIFITNYMISGYSGSVLVVLDLARKFRDLGNEVVVLARHIYGQVLNEFEKENITLLLSTDPSLKDQEPDLLWVQHNCLLLDVLKTGLKPRRVINSSLSHYVSVERPLLFIDEINAFLFHSEENFRIHVPENHPALSKCFLMENFAHDSFFDYKRANPLSAKLTSVLFVTNHPTEEMTKSMELLNSRDIKADMVGSPHSRMITPELLGEYDAVVTIGRTVQMCMAEGIPVYCYDHFGGPGYITRCNFDTARKENFSGRCCETKKTPEVIADELIRDYKIALKEIEPLKELAREKFHLDNQLPTILDFIEKSPAFVWNHDKYASKLEVYESAEFGRIIDEQIHSARSWDYVIEQRKKMEEASKELESEILLLKKNHKVAQLEKHKEMESEILIAQENSRLAEECALSIKKQLNATEAHLVAVEQRLNASRLRFRKARKICYALSVLLAIILLVLTVL